MNIVFHSRLVPNDILLNINETYSQNEFCIFSFLERYPIDNEAILEQIIKKYQFLDFNKSSLEVQAVHFDKLNEYYSRGFCICKTHDNTIIYLINNIRYIKNLDSRSGQIFLIRKNDLTILLENQFEYFGTLKSKYLLDFISDNATAKNINFFRTLTANTILFISITYYFSYTLFLASNLLFLVNNIFNITIFQKSYFHKRKKYINDIKHKQISPVIPSPTVMNIFNTKKYFPVYTILIPMYKETEIIQSIIKSVMKLNYPTDRLDIKFIIESDDHSMIKALAILNIPKYIQVIKVPKSFPRTKPKALNYVMDYVIGEYLVIYDADDIPDPNQLLTVLDIFNKLDNQHVCVQTKLNFYNYDQNLLTRFLNLEYSLWFQYLIKGLNILNLPIPLGGTSNHFKTFVLRKIGGWDSYNVTEDADIGLRLYAKGYKTHVTTDTTTFEEAPFQIKNWLTQRSRWIKGFIQTLCIFIINASEYKKLSVLEIISIYVFIGCSTYCFITMPMFIIFSIIVDKQNKFINSLCNINILLTLSYFYISAFVVVKDMYKGNWIKKSITILLWPVYFILHSIAAYKALIECIYFPFKWNKTLHKFDATGKNNSLS
ncbi:glycosyltransferase [Rickettsia endosymbiont of Cardiosporidium cionae]|uniref:glycosyltransferase n=1 Tax=Rickettsia endosymbiont of Cardiosporidium cionae TaxID=2777155 RepID=UPI001894B372|nr:glycosyltransferase [Rickettsia endosymbiont of Cardiosporidium cionae]